MGFPVVAVVGALAVVYFLHKYGGPPAYAISVGRDTFYFGNSSYQPWMYN
jgi:hypothetical protein